MESDTHELTIVSSPTESKYPPDSHLSDTDQAESNANESYFLKFMYRHPYLVMTISMSIAIIMAIIPIFAFNLNVFNSEHEGVMVARGDPIVDQWEAYEMIMTPSEYDSCGSHIQELALSYPRAATITVFQSKDGNNLLTNSRLNQVKSTLDKLNNLGSGSSLKYQFLSYCQMIYSTEGLPLGCRSDLDPLSFLSDSNGTIYSDNDLPQTVSENFIGLIPFMHKDYAATGTSNVMQVMSFHGRPLKNIDSKYCSYRYKAMDQNFLYLDMLEEHYDSFFRQYDTDDLEVSFWDAWLIRLDIGWLMGHDLLLVSGSAFLVFIVLLYGTRSFLLSFFAFLHIFISFPSAAFVYSVIFGIREYPAMNMMSLFIILGIGADDVFIVSDAWQQSRHQSAKVTRTLETRLIWTWNRAARAMLVTSFTTFMAFVATAAVPIPAISVFGVFCSSVIFCNYVLVITWYPALHVIWSSWGYEPKLEIPEAERRSKTKEELDKGEIENIQKYRPVERFYYNYLGSFILNYKYHILVVFTFLVIGASIGASYIEAAKKLEFTLPPEITSGRAIIAFQDELLPNPDSVRVLVAIVMGIKAPYLDREGVDRNEEFELGEYTPYEDWDISSEASQQWVIDMCEDSETTNLLLVNTTGKCFMIEFRDFILSSGESFPVNEDIFFENLTTWIENPYATDYVKRIDVDGLLSGRMKFASIPFFSSMDFDTIDTQGEYDKWEAFTSKWNDVAPPKAGKLFHTSEIWVYMQSIKLLRRAAFTSLGFSMAVAFVALIIIDGNLIVACLAIFSIGGILACTLCFMVIIGWTIDIMESICITLIVGVSVDYCVHFGTAYLESHFTHREHKTRAAATLLGISVLNAGITTLGSTFFLFFCYFSFFPVFGGFLFMAIAFSLIFSHFQFLSLLCIFGPEDERYNIYEMWRKYVRPKLCKKEVQATETIELEPKKVETT